MNIKKLEVKDLAIELSSGKSFSFLIGAGVSYSSGVPTAYHLVKQIFSDIYYDEEKNYNKENISNDIDYQDIQKWIRQQKWYNHKVSEYSNALEKKYPTPTLRAKLFQKLISEKTPCQAHEFLAAIMLNKSLKANICLTTNFDPFLEYALIRESGNFPLVSYHEDDLDTKIMKISDPIILKLHGDFLYGNLANTDREIQLRLKGQMELKIKKSIYNRGLIVVGYAGNDTSIMDILIRNAVEPSYFSNGVYWIQHKQSKLSDKALTFLDNVKENNSYIINTLSADDFFHEITKICKINPKPKTSSIKNLQQSKAEILNRFKGELNTHYYTEPFLTKVEGNSQNASNKIHLTTNEFYTQYLFKDFCIYIIGPGGIGKSLFLKYMTTIICEKTDKIPIFIDLTKLSTMTIENYLESHFDKEELHQNFNHGKIVLLCDALDQSDDPDKIIEEIEHFSNDLLKIGNQMLISSRPETLTKIKVKNLFKLESFTQDQVSYVVKKNLEKYSDKRKADSLLSVIENDSSLNKMAKEPLLLSLLLSIYKQFGQVPRIRNEIFDRFISLILGGWQKATSPIMDFPAIRDLLAELAYKLYQGKSIVSIHDVKIFIQDLLPTHKITKREHLASEIINQLIENEIMELIQTDLQFRHEELRLYCTAVWIFHNIEKDALYELLRKNTNTIESTYYLSGMLDDSTELVRYLLDIDFTASVKALGNALFIKEDVCKSIINFTMNFDHNYELPEYGMQLAQNNSELIISYLEKMVYDKEGTDRTRAVAANVLGYMASDNSLATLIKLSRHQDDLVRMRSIVGLGNHIELLGPESIEDNDEALVSIASSSLDQSFDVRFHSSFLLGRLRKESTINKDSISEYNFFLYAFEGKPEEWIEKCRSSNPEIVKDAIARITKFSLGAGNGNWKFKAFCAVTLLEISELFPEEVTKSFVQIVIKGRDDFFVMKGIEILKQIDNGLAAKELCNALNSLEENSDDNEYSRWAIALALGILEKLEGIDGLIRLIKDEKNMISEQANDGLIRIAALYPAEVKNIIAESLNKQNNKKSEKLDKLLNTIVKWNNDDAIKPSIKDLRKRDFEMFSTSNLMWGLRTGAFFNDKGKNVK